MLRSQLRLKSVGLSTPLRVIHKRFDIRLSIILSNASNWFKGKKKKKRKELSRKREDRGARERKIEGAIVDAEKRKRRKTREEENLPRSTSAVREAISNYFFLQNNYASSVHRTSSSRSYRTITVGRYRAELIDFSFRDSLRELCFSAVCDDHFGFALEKEEEI